MKNIFVFFGICSLSLAAFFLYMSFNFYQLSVITDGEIIDYQVRLDSEGDESSFPIIAFTTNQGEEITIISPQSAGIFGDNIGGIVEVRYNITKPRDARLDTFFALWGKSLILIGLGILFFWLPYKIDSFLFSSNYSKSDIDREAFNNYFGKK